ncbi:MAG: hypothetical protein HC822_10130 [Oscillochloris sp.]|nr:hypothetical protein [Oscillochloris sp.]
MRWRRLVEESIGWDAPDRCVWPIGQDAACAAELARRYCTVGGILAAIRAESVASVRIAAQSRALDADGSLAVAHGTRYPFVQGPMTRVSDREAFAEAVAEAGGLPFLALALMRGPAVATLLEATRERLGDRPWGVGILGFVPLELRREQLEVVRRVRPKFALIAGGRPDQARELEQAGIATYLHVPSPGLLKLFLREGARRFVFEGRECGGHVGPRSSLVLWDAMVAALLADLPPDPENLHLLFAGGIHDGRSAAMATALAAPLIARGVKVGVLMGTAYLFTHEAVASGAILPGFQEVALNCSRTVLLESGPGHATRCAENPYSATFQATRQQLAASGAGADQQRAALEELNLGRLRIAAKGVAHNPNHAANPHEPRYLNVDAQTQLAEGMYMIGQLAALRNNVVAMAELHAAVAAGATAQLQAAAAQLPATVLPGAEQPSDVAVIGMACMLPGAPDLKTYWEHILQRVDALGEIPAERWDWRRYYDQDRRARDKIYARWGGFLAEIAFDPTKYGIPPNALRSIEPIQLLALEAARAAFADAGYSERPFPRERSSVILGAGGGAGDLGERYAVRSALPSLIDPVPDELLERLPEWTEDSFPGILLNVIAGRIANRFDLGGVNYTVDAACASSLAAIALAVRELEAGSSDLVIAGGVDNVQNPFGFLCFSKTQALSAQGRSRPFDQQADGIVISEGVAMVVLKRLADARRDGDRIYAVIKAVGGSSDGRDRSLTAPRPVGQARAIQRAYSKAGFSPATLGLVEAHGTGTVSAIRPRSIHCAASSAMPAQRRKAVRSARSSR